MRVLVTGANGFVGKNLCEALARKENVQLSRFDVDSAPADLDTALASADVVFHLAGVNRPKDVSEFKAGNTGFTGEICDRLVALGRSPKLVLSSSVQAELDNPYGVSKREAEEVVCRYSKQTGASGVVYRLKNLFGKWCRPNYNSVTATFCHNIATAQPIQISNPANAIELTYIDDVVAAFIGELADTRAGFRFAAPLPSRKVTLGELAGLITSFRESRQTLLLPDVSDSFVKALYSTYLSYLPTSEFAYALDIKTDNRGSLAEFIKSPSAGQMFISRTKAGITRGNHYHHTKVEKFMVVEGEAAIRFRQIDGADVIEYRVRGEEYKVVDIPPGYTHSIENIGITDLVTLFWANEIFDATRPDTFFVPVIAEGKKA